MGSSVTKAAAQLATGALSALSNFGVTKALGGGVFGIPQNKVEQLAQYGSLLTKKQKKQILDALQGRSGIQGFRLSKKQSGELFGTELASIGLPMLLNELTGNGLSVGRRGPRTYPSVYFPRTGGGRKKDWGWTPVGTKQPFQGCITLRSHPLRLENKPLSNFKLLDWVQELGIERFRGVFSRDNLPNKIKRECGILNLYSSSGPGTHWVCYRNIGKYCEYFHSFELSMPDEVKKYLSTSNKQIIYSGDEIQELQCLMWCITWLSTQTTNLLTKDSLSNT